MQTVPYLGSATTVTAVPVVGYHFVNWTDAGGAVISTVNPLTVTNVTAAMTITANFAINTYPVNFVAGVGGTISGVLTQTVPYLGSASSVTAIPNAGYLFVSWTGNGGFKTTAANPLTVTGVTKAMNIRANFAISAPVTTVAPASVVFPGQSIKTISTAQTVTVTNSGNLPLSIFSINLGGLNPGSFAQVNTCPIKGAGLALAPGASCTISVTFNPNTVGVMSASLMVKVAAPAVSATVALSGTGIAPVATVSPMVVSFGSVTRGLVSAPQTVTVSNTGTVPYMFDLWSGFKLGGVNPKDFTLVTGGSCMNGGTLAAGASCTVTVSFAPARKTAIGAKSATLTIKDAATKTPKIVTLSGTAL
jgi:uncharacterized repeat protein (TIGR02543 family)